MANLMGKTRKENDPYLIYKNDQGWEWRVLKAYSTKPNVKYARWFCAVSSPFTFGSYDLGDTYISDILLGGNARLVKRDPVVTDDLVPDPSELKPADFF